MKRQEYRFHEHLTQNFELETDKQGGSVFKKVILIHYRRTADPTLV